MQTLLPPGEECICPHPLSGPTCCSPAQHASCCVESQPADVAAAHWRTHKQPQAAARRCQPAAHEPHRVVYGALQLSISHQSVSQCYICSNDIHRQFMPALHKKNTCLVVVDLSVIHEHHSTRCQRALRWQCQPLTCALGVCRLLQVCSLVGEEAHPVLRPQHKTIETGLSDSLGLCSTEEGHPR
jgi:hypothetical protein